MSRDWVIRFNAAGVEGFRDRPRSGRPNWLDDGQLAAFKALVLRGPDPEGAGVSSWRAQDLCRLVAARFGVVYSGQLPGLPVHPRAGRRHPLRQPRRRL